jgi:hypothetical protein
LLARKLLHQLPHLSSFSWSMKLRDVQAVKASRRPSNSTPATTHKASPPRSSYDRLTIGFARANHASENERPRRDPSQLATPPASASQMHVRSHLLLPASTAQTIAAGSQRRRLVPPPLPPVLSVPPILPSLPSAGIPAGAAWLAMAAATAPPTAIRAGGGRRGARGF